MPERSREPRPESPSVNRIILADNLEVLPSIATESVALVYTDPPFNTGRVQRHTRIRTVRDEERGDRTGFAGRRYRTEVLGSHGFNDHFDDLAAFLEPRVRELHRVLSLTGSMFLHLDYREVHYCKLLCDSIFGRECFINEVIWAYDYGGRSKRRWPAKHDNILWYVKDPRTYTFHYDEIDRIPYLAPGLVGAEKAARGKTPTDVWWHTIVPTQGKERTGFPTQKPLGILRRIVRVHSDPGDLVLDCFAGSGTLGEAAAQCDRNFILIDSDPHAVGIMRKRLAFAAPSYEEVAS
ncbi:MAG: site-specific DNA-methyltransferase [Myxococcales bacterium]|nr:site-specific DNA-methyltransferase [Myxococcales bacterium]